MLRLQLLDPACDADAGRVDEHVDTAESLAVLCDEPLAILCLPDVGSDRGGSELSRGGLHPLGASRDERELEAFVPEHPPDREADARRAAGDECCPSHMGCLSGRQHDVEREQSARGCLMGALLSPEDGGCGRRLRTITYS